MQQGTKKQPRQAHKPQVIKSKIAKVKGIAHEKKVSLGLQLFFN